MSNVREQSNETLVKDIKGLLNKSKYADERKYTDVSSPVNKPLEQSRAKSQTDFGMNVAYSEVYLVKEMYEEVRKIWKRGN